MARYTLKTFCGAKSLEVFEHRAVGKLNSILAHPRMYRDGETDTWGNQLENPNRFEIFDSMREKLFEGNIEDTVNFVRTLQ